VRQKENQWAYKGSLIGPREGHFPETAEGATSQDRVRKQQSEHYSLFGDRRGGDKSGHGKKATERGTHFLETAEREGQVRTQKKVTKKRALTSWKPQRKGQVSMERRQPRRQHSLCEDHRGRNKS